MCVLSIKVPYEKSLETYLMIFVIQFFFFVLICRAFWICSRSKFISYAIIVAFSTGIFRNLGVGIEWVLRCKIKVHRKTSLKSRIDKTNVCIIFVGNRVSQRAFVYIYIYIYIYIYKVFSLNNH